MRRLFWWLFVRIRKKILYGNTVPPIWDRPTENDCPCCWREADEDYWGGNYLGSTDVHFGYEGARYWTEHWRCPRCGTKFQIDTSN